MPIHINRFKELLELSKYDPDEANFLVRGFLWGFDLEYEGYYDRVDTSKNIPLRDIGTESDLWCKMIKEVKAK